MNGKISFPMAWGRKYTVYGGPYKKKPDAINGHDAVGVKMAVEIDKPFDVKVDVRDFSVPTVQQLDEALPKVVEHVLSGMPVYVGCMGGIGRTGLMLAMLAKAFGIKDPVGYVRAEYMAHAVETPEQMALVSAYQIPDKVMTKIAVSRFWSWFGWSKNLTFGEKS